jgi:hypothetical protein
MSQDRKIASLKNEEKGVIDGKIMEKNSLLK